MADEVSVLVSDLEDIRSILLTDEARSEAWDLFVGYPRMTGKLQYSPLTKALGAMAAKVDAYLKEAEDDDSPEA